MTDPKKKAIRYKTVTLAKGGQPEVKQEFQHGPEKRSYTPGSVETGHPAYGKAGNGTSKGMNKALTEARDNKQIHAEHNGLRFHAGTASTEKKPDQHKVSIKINPTMKMVVPAAQKNQVARGSKPSGNKKMSITLGGSDRKGNPANKTGLGGKNSIRITKSKSFKPPGHR